MSGTYALLRLAERIELLSAQLYRLLADRFREDRATRALFLRLECEEDQHASRIRLLAARYRHDGRLLERVSATHQFLEGLVARGEAIVEEVARGAWGTDLAEVKRRLGEVELEFCHAHAHFLSEDGHPELRAFFAQLAEQDQEHARLLRGDRR
jgi:rubrerythrin